MNADGLVAIPFDHVASVYEAASIRHAGETRQMEDVKAGGNDRASIDAAFRRLGCTIDS